MKDTISLKLTSVCGSDGIHCWDNNEDLETVTRGLLLWCVYSDGLRKIILRSINGRLSLGRVKQESNFDIIKANYKYCTVNVF